MPFSPALQRGYPQAHATHRPLSSHEKSECERLMLTKSQVTALYRTRQP